MAAYVASLKAAIGKGRARLGGAPPSRSYLSLVPLAHFDTISDSLHDCDSKAAVDAIMEASKGSREAIMELRTVSTSALNKAKGIVAMAKSAREKADRAASEQARRAGGTKVGVRGSLVAAEVLRECRQ